jgi:hypothetical protein
MTINNINYINRFEANLKIYNETNDTNYTFEDVQNLFLESRELDCNIKHCMCGHKINKKFEIINPDTNDSMILGSNCIETYMIKTMQICKKCDVRYKFNAKSNNRCHNCEKIKIKCKKCNEIKKIKRSKKKDFTYCKKCIKKEAEEKKAKEEEKKAKEEEEKRKEYNKYCIDCGKFSSKYIRCYKCNLNKNNTIWNKYRKFREPFKFK